MARFPVLNPPALKPLLLRGVVLSLFAMAGSQASAFQNGSTFGQVSSQLSPMSYEKSASGANTANLVGDSLANLPALGSNFSQFELDNGMQVVVIPDHRSPIATHMVWYKVGSADEKPGETGIAHFLEHLMFKGTKDHPDGEFSRIIQSIGGQENAFTSYDLTGYFQRVAKQHLGLMMELEADRMANLVLREEQVAPERQVVQEERASRVESVPGSLLREAVMSTLYRNHPYGKPIIGWTHEIEELGLEEAINFYNTYYTPNNAILVVAGDVTVEEVKKLAKATYGKVERRAEPGERVRPQEPPQRTARTVTLHHERVTQPQISRNFVVPSYQSAREGEGYALDLLSYILGTGTNSRFYKELVVKQKIATSVGAGYRSNMLNDSQFSFYGVPAAGTELKVLEAKLIEELNKLVKDGVSEEELARAKRSILANTYYSQDRHQSLANIVGTALTTGGSIEDIKAWPQKLAGVSAKQVQSVAEKYLKDHQSVTGYLLPPKKAKAAMPPAKAVPSPKAAPKKTEN